MVVSRSFSSLNARAICHSTEDIEKVKHSVQFVLGDIELQISKTKGHHGNAMEIIEARTEKAGEIEQVFGRFSREDIEEIERTIESRMDDSCNLFLRLAKQDAFMEKMSLARDDDVISIRIKVRAYPAKRENAIAEARGFLAGILDRPQKA